MAKFIWVLANRLSQDEAVTGAQFGVSQICG